MGDGLLWMIFQRILIIADNNLHKLKLQIAKMAPVKTCQY